MRTLDLRQGSDEWIKARGKYRCASEAPIVMGASLHMTRAELVRMKATGGEKEFSDYVRKRILDKGHEAEAAGRELVEAMIGQDLYPVIGVDDSGIYLASFDGRTMEGEHALEHKLRNDSIAAQIELGELNPNFYWQLEHQMLVSDLPSMIFACSNGTADSLSMMTYRREEGRREQLIAAWDQFEEDVRNYKHVEIVPPPAPTAHEGLPALSIRVDGALALTSNLDIFGAMLEAFIEKIPAKPATDQEFADCEEAIKTLERAEAALKAAQESALSQTSSIEQMQRTVAKYHDLSRTNRLLLEKLVKARKESIRAEIIETGRNAFAGHMATLNKRLGGAYMPNVLTDFAGVVRAKKTVQSLRDAVDGELARAKLVANEVADQVQINLAEISKIGADRMHAFPDLAQLVLKPTADMVAHAKQRLADIDAKEAKRLEGERERIRAEEVAKLAAAPAPVAPAPVAEAPVAPVSVDIAPAALYRMPQSASVVASMTPAETWASKWVAYWGLTLPAQAFSELVEVLTTATGL